MKYLFDTNVVTALLAHKPVIWQRARHIRSEDIGLSVIVQHELYFGAINGTQTRRNLDAMAKLPFELLPFEPEDAFRAAEIRASLKARGTPIGAYDILIAGQALARDLTLVTRNIREFQRVEGLRLENWED